MLEVPLLKKEVELKDVTLSPQTQAEEQKKAVSCCTSIGRAVVFVIKIPENFLEGLVGRVVAVGVQKMNLSERAARIAVLSMAGIILGDFTESLIEQYAINQMTIMNNVITIGRIIPVMTAFFAIGMSVPFNRPFACVEGPLTRSIEEKPRLFLRANLLSVIFMSTFILPAFSKVQHSPDVEGLSNGRIAIYACMATVSLLLAAGMSKLMQHQILP